MHGQIQWTSYQFSTPEMLSEELYQAAKISPTGFRRELVAGHLRRMGTHVGRIVLVASGIAAVLIGIACLLDGSPRGTWAYTFEEVLAIIGTITALSGILSGGSFVKYAWIYRAYWLRVLAAAIDSASYEEFLIIARERQLLAR
jgi:hypothetical protein